MKTITKYVAYTGREFLKPEECADYEARCQKADAVMARLSPRPDGCDFANGEGYLQHSPKIFASVRAEILALAGAEVSHRWIAESIENPDVHPSWAGRIIGEACNERINDAWHRISCTDDKAREWGQPYFAAHPYKAKQKRLN